MRPCGGDGRNRVYDSADYPYDEKGCNHCFGWIQQEREKILPIGPADAAIAKISDVYKKVLYVKAENYQILVDIKDGLEDFMRDDRRFSNVTVQFDFNPADGF